MTDRWAVDHRPWPLPRAPWTMRQGWHDLLFAHWRVDPNVLRPTLPEGLELDLYDGEAWLAVVPFRMTGIRPRGGFGLPGLSAFPELNLRTYVKRDGRPGVWFYSLDADQRTAVRIARRFFHLPYFKARMRLAWRDGTCVYSSVRQHAGAPSADLHARYRPTGEVFRAEKGSLEEWLTERYCLYARSPAGKVFRAEIHHRPWPIQPAEASFEVNDIARGFLDLDLAREAEHLLFVGDLDVRVWWPRPVG